MTMFTLAVHETAKKTFAETVELANSIKLVMKYIFAIYVLTQFNFLIIISDMRAREANAKLFI